MRSLVFSLGSEDVARLAGTELARNGLKGQQIRILTGGERVSGAGCANDPVMAEELARELARGRVLLEILVDEQNVAAVERLIAMLGADARKLAIERAAANQRYFQALANA
jgi:hypothetical protein